MLCKHSVRSNCVRAIAQSEVKVPLKGGAMLQRIALATLALLGCSLHALGQQRAVPRPDGSTIAPSQIDENVQQLMQKAHVTGVGIVLFHGGKISYLKAYGYRDTEKSLPLTSDSVMTSASLSKAAFASFVMLLAQQRTIDLDKPI